jgi:glutathione S-transferase
MELVPLVTLSAVLLTFLFSARVGKLREAEGIKAPSTTGSETFERVFRVHANTVEQLVLFLPSLWLALPVLHDNIAAGIGALWLLGRVLYARGYTQDPAKRGPGMAITFIATIVLWLAAVVGALSDYTL